MFVVLSVIFIDLIGFSIIFPIFPVLQNIYGFTSANIGYVVVIFSAFMVLGALVFGILSDKYGRKYTLALPLIGAAFAYLWTSQSETVLHFLIGRAFSGFFAGAYSVAFAIASDLSSKENRIKNMSMIGAMFGLSFVIGPVIGGNLHTILPYILGNDFYTSRGLTDSNMDKHIAEIPFIFSAVMSLLAGLLTLICFKETFKPIKNTKKSSISDVVKSFFKSYSQPKMLVPTFMTMILTSILSGLQVFLGVWMAQSFNTTTQYIGYFWSFTAIIMIVTQFIIRSFFAKTNPIKITIVAWLGLAIGLVIMSYADTFIHLCLSSVVFYISFSFLQSSINTSVSLGGSENQQGLVFGMNQSINGLGRIIGPNLVGMIITITASFTTVWLYLGIVAVIMSIIAIIFAKKQKLITFEI